jgi:hypothetical protein
MELDYRTTDAGEAAHVDEDRFFRTLMTPIGNWSWIAVSGAATAAASTVAVVLLKRRADQPAAAAPPT